jgi:hypothetical protein
MIPDASERVFTLQQGAQQRVSGGLISLFSIQYGDPLRADLGVGTEAGRQWFTLEIGEQAKVEGLGHIELKDVQIAPAGQRSCVVIEVMRF